MNREEKVLHVSELKDIFENNSFLSLVSYRGVSASDAHQVRKDLRKSGSGIKVVKNSLMDIAIKETSVSYMSDYVVGSLAIVYSNDPVEVAKIVSNYIKKKVLDFKVASFNNSEITKDDFTELSQLVSIESSRSKFVGLLSASQNKFNSLLCNSQSKFINLLNEYSKKSS